MTLGRTLMAVVTSIGVNLASTIVLAQTDQPPSDETGGSGQPTPERDQAKALYEEGLAAYRQRRYTDAIDKLLAADRLMPNAAFSYNIGLVYEAMGDKRSALRWMRNYLRQSDKSAPDESAKAKVRRYEGELQKQGLQQVTILTVPPQAKLWIDGNGLGITPFTAEIAPGSHQVTVSLEGYSVAQQSFELRPDRSMDVELALTADLVKAADTIPVPAPVQKVALAPRLVVGSVIPWRHKGGVKPWTWVTVGVGAALLGGATIFELRRRSAEDEARNSVQRDYQSHFDQMEDEKNRARVLAVAGSVVAVAGLGLLTWDLTQGRHGNTATIASCATGGVCAAWRGIF